MYAIKDFVVLIWLIPLVLNIGIPLLTLLAYCCKQLIRYLLIKVKVREHHLAERAATA